jgi:hypothetical protein
MKSVTAVMLLALFLTGCALEQHLPSQGNPTCSWGSEVPANAQKLCGITFTTLSLVARAELRGDTRTIRRVVTNRDVAGRILAHTSDLHRVGVRTLHVVPSLTLSTTAQGYVGAGFYLLGTSKQGRIKSPQTVYLRVARGSATIVGDQSDQQW